MAEQPEIVVVLKLSDCTSIMSEGIALVGK